MKTAREIVNGLFLTEVNPNGKALARLDADEIDEYVKELEGRQETILDEYVVIIDENDFAKKVKDALITYNDTKIDGHDIDDMVFDILEVMGKLNEKARKAIS